MKDFTHTETDLAIEKEYPKLVRDRIPEIIEADGEKAVITVMDDSTYEKYLRKKVKEEAAELAEADTKKHTAEEAADLLEVVEALTELHGYTREDIERIRVQKNEQRGAFKQKLLMHGYEAGYGA